MNNCNENNFSGDGPLNDWIPDGNRPAHPRIRQILINEPNLDLRNIYFNIVLLDGQTPALDESNGQPEINITSTGWNSVGVSKLVNLGFGRYYATLSTEAVNQLGVILSRYTGTITLECFGETIEVIQNYRTTNIFNDGNNPTLLSYVTLSEAENYFATRYKVKAWEDAKDKDKLKTLCIATKDIDKLAFQGVKTSEYRFRIREFYIPGDWNDPYIGLSWVHWRPQNFTWDDRRAHTNRKFDNFKDDDQKELALNPWCQELEFPRNGDKIVPNNIKEATCEIAYQYLNGFDMELEIAGLQVTGQAFTSIRDSFDRRFVPEHVRAGINSARAWILLKPFIRDRLHIRTVRVS